MTKRWVENTGSRPRQVDGQWVLPGSGVFVDEPDPPGILLRDANVVSAPGGQIQVLIDGVPYGLMQAAKAAAAELLVSPAGSGSGANVEGYTARLLRTIFNRPIPRGCERLPRFFIYVDPVNGNDAWDGAFPAFVSGTQGPKRTLVTANWAGSPQTSIFSDTAVLFADGTTYTHPEALGRITTPSFRHYGRYATAQGQAMPVINGTIYGSGLLRDISISSLDIRPSSPNQSSIAFVQTAANQCITRLTVRGNRLVGGTINNATAIGGLNIGYFNGYSTQDEYMACHNILIEGNVLPNVPGHGIFLGGAIGKPIGQINGTAELTAAGNFSNGETVTIAGIVFTAVTTIGATAGNFLVGASKQASLANLAGLINNPSATSATQVALSAASQGVASTLGMRATVRGHVLTLDLTAFYATAWLWESAAAVSWSHSYIATEQIWGGVLVTQNIVDGAGTGMDCHALSSYSAGVLLSRTGLTWTNLTGSVWWTDASAAGLYGFSVPTIDVVQYDTGNGTELFRLLPAYCEPANLQPGEFQFDPANQRLYVNANATFNAAIRLSLCTRAAKGIHWDGNRLYRTRFNNVLNNGAKEGHGIAFDDFTSYCLATNNEIEDSAGVAITINRGDRNIVVGNFAKDFALGCVKGNFGWGNVIAKSVFVFNEDDPGDLGYSDTVPGFRGYLHIATASTRMGVFSGSFPNSSNDFSAWFANIVHDVDLVWNGTATGVAAILGPTSGNAPPVMASRARISGSASMVPHAGRVVLSPVLPEISSMSLPINVDALR